MPEILPLIGASVVVQGTTIGTITDFNGKYSINVPDGGTIVFSYTGYKPQTRVIKSGAAVNVALAEAFEELEEVVAIGYGTVKKSDLTGAVGSLSGDKLRASVSSGVDRALQGQLAGVTVNANSGQPGEDATIRVRGVGTITDANPIYVVDGLITDNIRFLSPSDIQSLEVLKDASAQAIYGSRGANGVILITTRKGTKGKGRITFDSYFGVQNRWNKLDVMKRDELVNMLATFEGTKDYLDANGLNAWVSQNRSNPFNNLWPAIKTTATPNGLDLMQIDTDWQDEVFVRNAPIQNYYLSLDGGSDNGTFLMSVNYFDQKGTLIASSYDRLTVRINSAYQVRKWLKVGENFSLASSSSYNIPNNSSVGMLYYALQMAPWDPVKYPEGTMSRGATSVDLSGRYSTPTLFPNAVNPYVLAYNEKPYNNSLDVVGNIYMEIKPITELTVRGSVSMKYWDGLRRNFTPEFRASYLPQNYNGVFAQMDRAVNMTYEGTATYNKRFAEKHDVSLMIGATAEDNNWYMVNASGRDYLNQINSEKNWYVSKTPGDEFRTGSDGVSKERMVSFLGRAMYTYADKYLLTASLRQDGSSRLPPGYYWDVFPSVSGAWRFSEEGFFEPLSDIFNSAKLRAGWGRIGNIGSIGLNSSQATVTTGEWFVGYPLGNPKYIYEGMSLLTVPLRCVWERTDQIGVGLDFSTLRNRMNVTVDWFHRQTNGMLMDVPAPGHVGYGATPVGNAGDVRNQGFELTIAYRNTINNDFSYNVSANASFIKNKLTALNGGNPIFDNIIMQNEGYPLNTIYVIEYAGVFKTQEEIDNYTWTDPVTGVTKKIQPDARPGDAKYIDKNNDGKIDDSDRYNAGNPFPSVTYGLNVGLAWKGFDFSFFLQGVGGVQVYNFLRQNLLEESGAEGILGSQMSNVYFPVQMDPNDPNSWANGLAGSNGSIPNPTNTGSPNNRALSSRFVENASYLRLKNIELGYTLPAKTTSAIGIDRLRIYVSVTNLLTFTNYTGYDPEVGVSGRDYGNYPQSRNFIFGLNMNF